MSRAETKSDAKTLAIALLIACSFWQGGAALGAGLPLAKSRLAPASSEPVRAFIRNLQVGSSGAEVAALQEFLIGAGILDIPAPTRHFGPRTRAAVGAWQRANGISPPAGSVGRFGPITREKLNALLAARGQDVARDVGTTADVPRTRDIPIAAAPKTKELVHEGLPRRLRIPGLAVDALIAPVGLTSGGAMDVPKHPDQVVWYSPGTRPGESGSAVIAGHYDWIRGQTAVFKELHKLRAGDALSVEDDKGKTASFKVRETRYYDSEAVAPEIFAPAGEARLNLITCAGAWDASKKNYAQRLVVFADLVPSP